MSNDFIVDDRCLLVISFGNHRYHDGAIADAMTPSQHGSRELNCQWDEGLVMGTKEN